MLSIGHPSSLQGAQNTVRRVVIGMRSYRFLTSDLKQLPSAEPLLAPIGRCWPRSATRLFRSPVPFHRPYKQPFSKGDHVNPVLLTQYCSGDKIEKNEMGMACSAYGGEERRIQGFGRET